MYTLHKRHSQQGAALVVSLLLLVVITVLAVSGMNTATTELAMVRNSQTYENVFQAAETGLETALGQVTFQTAASVVVVPSTSTTYNSVSAQIDYEGTTMVPDKAYSLGSGSGIMAHHFRAVSQAQAQLDPGNPTDRDSTAVHTQAFYIVGQDPGDIDD